MAWQTFSHGDLTVDAQFGDPTLLIVVGKVDAGSCATLLDAVAAALARPGSPSIEVNIVLARFADDRCRQVLFDAQESARSQGRRFTIS